MGELPDSAIKLLIEDIVGQIENGLFCHQNIAALGQLVLLCTEKLAQASSRPVALDGAAHLF